MMKGIILSRRIVAWMAALFLLVSCGEESNPVINDNPPVNRPFKVVSVKPDNPVDVTSSLYITFSDTVNRAAFNDATMVRVSPKNKPDSLIQGQVLFIGHKEFRFRPDQNFSYDDELLVSLQDVTSIWGVKLPDTSIERRTKEYNAPPPVYMYVTNTDPHDGATNVDYELDEVKFFLSEAIDPQSVDPGDITFDVPPGQPGIEGTIFGDVNAGGDSVWFSLTDPLPHSTPLQVTLSGVRSLDGHELENGEYTISFTTRSFFVDSAFALPGELHRPNTYLFRNGEVLDDGRVIAIGTHTKNAVDDNFIVRFNMNGAVDTFLSLGPNDYTRDIELTPDGGYYVSFESSALGEGPSFVRHYSESLELIEELTIDEWKGTYLLLAIGGDIYATVSTQTGAFIVNVRTQERCLVPLSVHSMFYDGIEDQIVVSGMSFYTTHIVAVDPASMDINWHTPVSKFSSGWALNGSSVRLTDRNVYKQAVVFSDDNGNIEWRWLEYDPATGDSLTEYELSPEVNNIYHMIATPYTQTGIAMVPQNFDGRTGSPSFGGYAILYHPQLHVFMALHNTRSRIDLYEVNGQPLIIP